MTDIQLGITLGIVSTLALEIVAILIHLAAHAAFDEAEKESKDDDFEGWP